MRHATIGSHNPHDTTHLALFFPTCGVSQRKQGQPTMQSLTCDEKIFFELNQRHFKSKHTIILSTTKMQNLCHKFHLSYLMCRERGIKTKYEALSYI